MREIKFRAWDKNKKYMFEVIGISWFANHSSIWQVSGYDILEPIDNVDIMQFTGLLDKNGREIFEGDIVDYVNEKEMIGRVCNMNDPNPDRKIVAWYQDECKFDFNNIDNTKQMGGFTFCESNLTKYFEVIGNLYKSPELLEGKEKS